MVVGCVKNATPKMTVVLNFVKIVEHTNKFNVKDIFFMSFIFLTIQINLF